jgi:hypothetical protein
VYNVALGASAGQLVLVKMPPLYGMMYGMEKTTVYLTADQKAALARAAASEGRSEARLIRTGIDIVTARHRTAETPAPTYGPEAGDEAARSMPPLSETSSRPRWLPRGAFVREILRHPADAALRGELRDLAPGTTDEARLG